MPKISVDPQTSSLYSRLLSKSLRFFFYLLYHQLFWTYDWVANIVSLGRWRNWIESVLPFLVGQEILELGHGPGHLQSMLGRVGRKVIGLDSSFFMSRLARRNLLLKSIRYHLVNGQAQRLPFPANSFSSVAATFPSEYIADSATMLEIYRILSPTGRLVILPFAWITGSSLQDRLARWMFKITYQAPDENQFEIALESFLRLDEATKIGFQVATHIIDRGSSKTMVIVADKSS
jgi:ubiquinone/menaquinone biosynthesis C-methylase UbiE